MVVPEASSLSASAPAFLPAPTADGAPIAAPPPSAAPQFRERGRGRGRGSGAKRGGDRAADRKANNTGGNARNVSVPASATNETPVAPSTAAAAPAAAAPVPILTTHAPAPSAQREREAKHAANQTELGAQIVARLMKNTYECMICIQSIGRQAKIWACVQCYALFHFTCITKWSKSAGEMSSWRCPGCQYVNVARPDASCFCRKQTDPEFNPYLVPHSCGELCGKPRAGSDCPHVCSIVCHPGPCPPCAAIGPMRMCFCGRTTYRTRCGERDDGRSCKQPCKRKLNCGRHECQDVCHKGECAKCTVKHDRMCYCGRKTKEMLCGTETPDFTLSKEVGRHFSCTEPCGRPLLCGKHMCTQPCHPGECATCALLPDMVRTCPCGKTAIEQLLPQGRRTCEDPIPTCPSVCGRKLACGLHTCKRLCHRGECGDCRESVVHSCRCGRNSVTTECHAVNVLKRVYTCQSTCQHLRSCGRHQCNVRCCPTMRDPTDPDGMHVCRLVCGKLLKCGLHKCDMACHKGRCGPCVNSQFDDYVCRCGATTMRAPIACGTPIPQCPNTCTRDHGCTHAPNHLCHNDAECPRCVHLVQRWCVGHHELRANVPCYLREVSCGKHCGRPLACRQHTCARLCHGGACESHDGSMQTCGQVCGAPLRHCAHRCNSPCHPGVGCSPGPCKQTVRITCLCGRRTGDAPCNRGGATAEEVEENEAAARARHLDCDDLCETEKRNKRLAEAFGKLGADKPTETYRWPPDFVQLCQSVPAFVVQVEKKFAELLQGSNSTVALNVQTRVPRRIIEEMARAYRLEPAPHPEPDRFVSVARTRESRFPYPLLSTQLKAGKPKTICAIHIHDLSPDVRTLDLVTAFAPFDGKYHLKWVDDANALAVFTSLDDMRAALSTLMNGRFKVREFQEGSLPQVDELLLATTQDKKPTTHSAYVLLQSKKTAAPVGGAGAAAAKKERYALNAEEAVEYKNFFSPLNDGPAPALAPAAAVPAAAAAPIAASAPPAEGRTPISSWPAPNLDKHAAEAQPASVPVPVPVPAAASLPPGAQGSDGWEALASSTGGAGAP